MTKNTEETESVNSQPRPKPWPRKYRESNLPNSISFTVYCKPEPQGSIRAFMPKGWKRPVLTSDNKDLKSFRQEVSKTALLAAQQYKCAYSFDELPFPKHQPVEMTVAFYFQRPPSIPKKRTCHVVKPDLSKLLRAAEDSLTGIIYADDAQIVRIHTEKHYGAPERVCLEVKYYEEVQ